MDEKNEGNKKKYLPCMYDHSIDCKPGSCSGYHETKIQLPIIDEKGGKIFTHCLVLAMGGMEIEEFSAFSTNMKNAARAAIKMG